MNNIGQVAVIPGAKGIVAFLICKITGSHCHHMIVITGENECVSADPEGVRKRPLTDFPDRAVSRFELTPEQVDAVVAFAYAQVDKPYAYLDDALIAIERIFSFRFPHWVRARFADDGQWQCAELADAALYAGGLRVFKDDRMFGDVYPGSYEFEFVKRRWYTELFFKSFPITPW